MQKISYSDVQNMIDIIRSLAKISEEAASLLPTANKFSLALTQNDHIIVLLPTVVKNA